MIESDLQVQCKVKIVKKNQKDFKWPILQRKSKAGSLMLTDLRIYYNGMTIKTV
jgi:hypothetical protein